MHEKLPGTEDLLAKSEARKKLPDKNLDFQVCKLLVQCLENIAINPLTPMSD